MIDTQGCNFVSYTAASAGTLREEMGEVNYDKLSVVRTYHQVAIMVTTSTVREAMILWLSSRTTASSCLV